MAAFTFEILRTGEAPRAVETIDVPDESLIWRHVEALALRTKAQAGTFIRVRDQSGQAVVRAGVATALASISNCSCAGCPIKRAALRGEVVPENEVGHTPCDRRGAGACGRGS